MIPDIHEQERIARQDAIERRWLNRELPIGSPHVEPVPFTPEEIDAYTARMWGCSKREQVNEILYEALRQRRATEEQSEYLDKCRFQRLYQIMGCEEYRSRLYRLEPFRIVSVIPGVGINWWFDVPKKGERDASDRANQRTVLCPIESTGGVYQSGAESAR